MGGWPRGGRPGPEGGRTWSASPSCSATHKVSFPAFCGRTPRGPASSTCPPCEVVYTHPPALSAPSTTTTLKKHPRLAMSRMKMVRISSSQFESDGGRSLDAFAAELLQVPARGQPGNPAADHYCRPPLRAVHVPVLSGEQQVGHVRHLDRLLLLLLAR